MTWRAMCAWPYRAALETLPMFFAASLVVS